MTTSFRINSLQGLHHPSCNIIDCNVKCQILISGEGQCVGGKDWKVVYIEITALEKVIRQYNFLRKSVYMTNVKNRTETEKNFFLTESGDWRHFMGEEQNWLPSPLNSKWCNTWNHVQFVLYVEHNARNHLNYFEDPHIRPWYLNG